MTNLAPIARTKITPWQRTKGIVKKVYQKAYLHAPLIGTLGLYTAYSKITNQPMWRKGSEENIYEHMMAFGLWIGYESAKDGAIANGIDPKKASLAYFATGLGGVLGAQALNLAQFSENVTDLPQFLSSAGGTWYGGVMGGLAGLAIFSKLARVPFLKLLDALTPAALIAHGIGRIGCWSAGCCIGNIFGIPTEPVSAAFNIILGLWLTKAAKSPSFKGRTSLLGLTAYALFRFAIEFFRNEPSIFMDDMPGIGTLSQMISLGILTTAGILYKKLSKAAPSEKEAAPTQPAPQTFKHHLLESAALFPAIWYAASPVTSIIIGSINILRTIKSINFKKK